MGGTRLLMTSALVASLAAAGACDRQPTAPSPDELTADDVAALAIDQDLIAGGVVFEQIGRFALGLSVASPQDSRTFDVTRDCPAGGTVHMEGSVERTTNGEGAVQFDLMGTRTLSDCAHERNDVRIVTNGTANYDAHRQRVQGQPAGNQTMHVAGTFSWTRTRLSTDESRSGECTFDVTSVRNADARSITITGTMCGRQIDRTIDWRHGT